MLMDDYPEECERAAEELKWGEHLDTKKVNVHKEPSSMYNMLSSALRQKFPHESVCSMFCGGTKCKYCCPDTWKEDEQAIKGLYSHWVTDNVLATSRPVTKYVEQFGIIKRLQDAGINAIINVQLPGEHASCGYGLENGEFSYKQQDFMDNGIFFYNFGWNDFGVVESMPRMLDMVKVMQFAVSQGKVAVHCHAGKGRTGVLIGCFLVYNNRMSANEAVHYVRSKRPKSIQTGPQVNCIQVFEKFLKPFRVIFTLKPEQANFNLLQFLNRQRAILHGYQARKLKHLPKIIFIICERLLSLAKKNELLHIPSSTSIATELESSPSAVKSKSMTREDDSQSLDDSEDVLSPKLPMHVKHVIKDGIHGTGTPSAEVENIGKALIAEELSKAVQEKARDYMRRLNEESMVWEELKKEDNLHVLSVLLWEWLDHLKDPIIRRQDLDIIYDNIEQPQEGLNRLEKGAKTTVVYLMEFIAKLQPIHEELECDIIQRLVSSLMHMNLKQSVAEEEEEPDVRASNNTLLEFKGHEKHSIFKFFYNLLEVVEDGMTRK